MLLRSGLKASLGASIVSLGALLRVARRVRKKDQDSLRHSSTARSSTARSITAGSSQRASLWLRSLCGDPASSSSWLTEQNAGELLVFHAQNQQLARVAGPPSAPNTGHSCKHELVVGACEATLEAALTFSPDGDLLLLPLDSLFCATAVHVEEQQPCLVFASMWAGSKVLTASKEPGHHPMLKPFTGAHEQKWTLDDRGDIVNARWPDMALGMSGQRVQATRVADAVQHDRATCTKIQELEENLEVMEEQHSSLVDALEAEHQEQVQGLQQQWELEQRKSRAQEEKLEGLAGLVGQLQSRLGREQAACRHTSELLQQERARVAATEELLAAAHGQLGLLAQEAAQKQQEAAEAKAALVASHERQIAAMQQQQQQAAHAESTRLRQEMEQVHKDLASMTAAKDEAFRFLEAMQAQTRQKDQVNEALLDKCCTLDATLQAIDSKIGIICNERRVEPLQRSLQAADLGRLRRRLDQLKDSCNNSPCASPVLALPETRGRRSPPLALQQSHGADDSHGAKRKGSKSRSPPPAASASPGCGFESDKSEESQRVEGIVQALEEESSSSNEACSLRSIMRTAHIMRESIRASIRDSLQLQRAGMPRLCESSGGSAQIGGRGSGGSSVLSGGSSNSHGSTNNKIAGAEVADTAMSSAGFAAGEEIKGKGMSGAGRSQRVLGDGQGCDAMSCAVFATGEEVKGKRVSGGGGSQRALEGSRVSDAVSSAVHSAGKKIKDEKMSGVEGSQRVSRGGRVSDVVRQHEARQRQQQAEASRSFTSTSLRVAVAEGGSRPVRGGINRARVGGVWSNGGVVDKGTNGTLPGDRISSSSSGGSSSSGRLHNSGKVADVPALACSSAGGSRTVRQNSTAGDGIAPNSSACNSSSSKGSAAHGDVGDTNVRQNSTTGDGSALHNSARYSGSKDSAAHGNVGGSSGRQNGAGDNSATNSSTCNSSSKGNAAHGSVGSDSNVHSKGSICSGCEGSMVQDPLSTALWLQHMQASHPQPPSLATNPDGSPLPPSLGQAVTQTGQSPSTPSLRRHAAHAAAAAASISTPFQAEQPPARAPGTARQREGQGTTASSTPSSSSSSSGSKGTTIVHHHHHQRGMQDGEAQQGSCQSQPLLQQQQQQQQQQTLQMRRVPGIPLPALRVDSGEREVPFFSASNSQSSSSACNTCCNMGSTRLLPEGSQWGGGTPNYHSHCGTPSYAANHAKTTSHCSQMNFWPGTPHTPSQQQQQQQQQLVDMQASHGGVGATATAVGDIGSTQLCSHHKRPPQALPQHARPHHHRRTSSVVSPLLPCYPAWLEQGVPATPKPTSTRGAADNAKIVDQHAADDVKVVDQGADVPECMATADPQADGPKVWSQANQRKDDHAPDVHLRNTQDWAQQPLNDQQQQPPQQPALQPHNDQQQQQQEGAGGDGGGAGWEDENEEVDMCASPCFSGAGVQLLQSLQQLRNTPNKRHLSILRDGDSSDEEGGRTCGY